MSLPEVTLSFDNGPEPEVTPQVLDVLRHRGILATFFVLGHKMAEPARQLSWLSHEDQSAESLMMTSERPPPRESPWVLGNHVPS
jgi:peptidoglycan/xylan/chitin deacetylase (PgdA/CDA1 family)